MSKRKNPEPNQKPGGSLIETERVVLNIIKSRKENAIYVKDLKTEAKIPDSIFNKCIKNLQTSGQVREIPHVQFRGRKHYISTEFKPSKEITGGSWFLDGELDKGYIKNLEDRCIQIIKNLKVATDEGVYNIIMKNKVSDAECTSQQVSEILRSLVLDNSIIEVKSTQKGEYHGIGFGKLCYRLPPEDLGKVLVTGAMASIPCGVCPRIRECTPDGLISPSTCVYYNKWLEF